MKRLVLALVAATALGTGCGSSNHPCRRSITVDWSSGFVGADGVRRDCASAFVTYVDLFINDDPNTAVRVPCSQAGAQAVDLAGGDNRVTVEGIDVRGGGTGRIAYRAEQTIATACGDQRVALTPAEGTLALNYAFSPSNVCAPQPTYMWTQVFDRIANEIAFRDTAQSAANQCGATLTFRLPAGLYTLDGINEVAPGVGAVGADCTHRDFEIQGAATTPVSTSLVDSSAACF